MNDGCEIGTYAHIEDEYASRRRPNDPFSVRYSDDANWRDRCALGLKGPETNPTEITRVTEVLESYCPDSRVHALINNPTEEGIDEG